MSRQYSPYSATRDGYAPTGYASIDEAPTDDWSEYDFDPASGYGADAPTDRQRRYAGRDWDPEDDHHYGAAHDYDAHDYGADYEYPADYHEQLDRRWIWVAGVAGAVLMIAVICTGVILGGGDSGTVTAATTTAAPADDAAAPSAAPAPADLPGANLSPETITTVTPTPAQPSATAAPEPTPTVQLPAPVAPAPPAPPALDPATAAQTVTYRVTGNRQLIDLVTIIYTDQQGALQTDVNVALPWVKTVTLNPGVTLSSVTATSVGGQLNCAILDGNGTALAVQTNNSMIATCTR